MADAFPAMRSQHAAPINRADRPALRPSVANAIGRSVGAGFQKELSSGAAAIASEPAVAPEPTAGRALISNGGNLILAQTRTFEEESGFAPSGSADRARSSYLAVQKQINDSLRASRFSALTGADNDFDEDSQQRAALALAGSLALSDV